MKRKAEVEIIAFGFFRHALFFRKVFIVGNSKQGELGKMVDFCDMCNSELKEKGMEEIGSTLYRILRCDKCKKQIIRRSE